MAALEIVALDTATPQLRAPGAGDTYLLPRDTALTSGATLGWSTDLFIRRDAANTLALRNGTNAQTFNVYNTFTDASNYERGFVRYSGNVLEVGHENAGTGSARTMRLRAGSADILTVVDGSNTNTAAVITTSYSAFRSVVGVGSQANSPDVFFVRGASAALTLAGNTAGSLGAVLEFVEQTAPVAPASNRVRIFAEDNGSGKTRLMARFNTGAAQQIAIEP